MPQVQPWANLEDAARDAYEVYGAATKWKNYQGQAMPLWSGLPDAIKQAWGAAVRHTLAKAYRIVAAHLVEHVQEDCEQNCTELGYGTKAEASK